MHHFPVKTADHPRIATERIGRDAQPLVVIDGFAADPDALRDAAIGARFDPAGQHYPGIRAPLPADYWQRQLPVIARAMGTSFGRFRRLRVIDASFSIVTVDPAGLRVQQRLPHVDAYGEDRIALIHYLAPEDAGGTAFYRHRATGFETVDEARAPTYFAAVERDLAEYAPTGYIAGDTAAFAQTHATAARWNRALVYRSFVLHSGVIAPDAALSPDPASGRLTVTGFLAME